VQIILVKLLLLDLLLLSHPTQHSTTFRSN
jgi:hypothetical protein